MNTGTYSVVEGGAVTDGPRRLPNNWEDSNGDFWFNLSNDAIWDDQALHGIGWYPTTVTTPDYDPLTQKLGDYQFIIHQTSVDAEREVLDKTQEEIDKSKPTDLTQSQQVAADLALQTETLLRQNEDRVALGAAELIPADDVADTQTYLKGLYDAMDDSANPVQDPPGSIRQIVAVPGENRDRAVVKRTITDWAGTLYYGLGYTLYTTKDVTGMSMKVHRGDGTYISTFNLTEQSPGVWYAETNIHAEFTPEKDLKYVLFHGIELTQMRDFVIGETEQVFDLRWADEGTFTVGHG